MICYVPGAVLGPGNTTANKTDKTTKCPQGSQQVINKYGVVSTRKIKQDKKRYGVPR